MQPHCQGPTGEWVFYCARALVWAVGLGRGSGRWPWPTGTVGRCRRAAVKVEAMAILAVSEVQPESAPARLSHLKLLEAESIHIFREVAAEFERPAMLYSIGKDSSVMLRLAQKAFHPGPVPFPLLHVDTGYKFREMLEFRDAYTRELGLDLIVWRNEEALAAGANPVRLGTQRCCGLLKTTALLDALRTHGFD